MQQEAEAMITPNEFWLAVHQLAEAYDSEGPTMDERAENIADEFDRLPFVTQRELLQNLLRIAAYLPDLCPRLVPRLRFAAPAEQTASA